MVTANQHRHDLSAAFTHTNLRLACFKKGARLQHFANTYRVRGGGSLAMGDKSRLGKMFPLHCGDAKHPAAFAA